MANIKARKVHKFDFKPFSQKQLRVLNWWSEYSPVKDRRMMIADGSIRAGKSQPLTSKLYTPYGYKLMGDIKVGDYVFDRNGKQTKVLELFPQGKLDTYRITFSDGSSTECSKEHLWTYTTRKCIANGNYTFFTSTLEDIMKDLDRFSDRKLENQRAGKYMFPINGCVEFTDKPVKIDPYLLGLLLGDGCFTEKNMGISFYGDELELHKDVSNIVARYDMSSNYVDRNDKHCGVTHLITNKLGHKSNLRIFLEEYNLYGCYSHNKFIPNDYLYNSKDVRYKVLAGLLNTDGSVHNTNKPSIEFCSTSLKLFTGVVTLARSLGMFVNTRRKIDSREKLNNVVFSCSIRVDRELYSLLSSKHRNRLNLETVKDEKWRYIVSIEYVGKFEHQCILVDNKEHLYITDDFIVTHNTLAITLSFILFVMKNYNNQNAAISGKSVGAVRRNIIPNMLSMLLSLGFDYVDHRSDNYIEIIKGDTVNNVYLFGLVF